MKYKKIMNKDKHPNDQQVCVIDEDSEIEID